MPDSKERASHEPGVPAPEAVGGGSGSWSAPRPAALDVEHVTYDIGTVDSLDYNLRNCLPQHRDALLDARAQHYPNAPTEGGDLPATARESS